MTRPIELLEFLSDIMKKLDNKEISIEEAKAQANLVKQSNNLLRYELDAKKFEYKVNTETINNMYSKGA